MDMTQLLYKVTLLMPQIFTPDQYNTVIGGWVGFHEKKSLINLFSFISIPVN